ncbi:MAG: hypothetical protein RR330_03685 [Alistipes sp.]
MFNNTISLRRIALYARKHYTENSRSYLTLLLLIFLSLLFLLWAGSPFIDFVAILYVITGIAWIQRTCGNFYKPLQAIQAYTFPVSQAEKYLFCWFNSLIVFSLVFLLLFGIVIAISHIQFLRFFPITNVFSHINFKSLLFYFAFIHALALFSCSWTKKSPAKGYFLLFALATIYLIIDFFIRRLMPYSDGFVWVSSGFDPHAMIHVIGTNAILSYDIVPFPYAEYMIFSVTAVATVVFWVVGYFKFKERTLK